MSWAYCLSHRTVSDTLVSCDLISHIRRDVNRAFHLWSATRPVALFFKLFFPQEEVDLADLDLTEAVALPILRVSGI